MKLESQTKYHKQGDQVSPSVMPDPTKCAGLVALQNAMEAVKTVVQRFE